jgi:hypothetical protein
MQDGAMRATVPQGAPGGMSQLPAAQMHVWSRLTVAQQQVYARLNPLQQAQFATLTPEHQVAVLGNSPGARPVHTYVPPAPPRPLQQAPPKVRVAACVAC